MSIEVQIANLLGGGVLTELPRAVPRSPRHILMTETVSDMVAASFDDTEDERFAECRAHLESFVRNNYFSVGWDPDDKKGSAGLARVNPTNLCVFDFRSKGDDGGIRVFGGFARKDWFVAVSYRLRNEVDWIADVQDSANDWIKLFGAPIPNLGPNPNDYLSGNYCIV